MKKRRRVAISLDLDWGFKRHLEVYAGCQRYADKAGWACDINPGADRALKPGARQIRYDGVIARATQSLADASRQAGVPVVNVWRNSPARDLPSVFADHEAAGTMAAEHLLGRGFRQFGYLGFLREEASRLELAAFRAATRRSGHRCSVHRFSRFGVTKWAPGWEVFVSGLDAWIDTWKPPIGIFVIQDLICRYLIELCKAKGLHIAHDVAIVGCGNEPMICSSPSPTLTSIDLGSEEIGYRAAELLDRLMAGKPPPEAPVLVAPAGLIPRESTDSYAAEDPVVARALRFIGERAHRPMQVKDVTAAVATTRRTLERKFRASVGRCIAEEIVRMRLERAKRRLAEGNASMKTVALDAGFRTAKQFHKVFARVEGLPPTEYRQQRTHP